MGEYLHKAYEYASAENDAKKSESRENILEKLISFSKYGETHYLLKILGIKFKSSSFSASATLKATVSAK